MIADTMKLYLTSLGCKLNWAELESFRRQITSSGHSVVDDVAQADWAVVNTCTVTHVAERKSRQVIRRLARENPRLHIAVVGCYAEVAPDAVGSLEGVALCVGNQEKRELISRILATEAESAASDAADPLPEDATPRTRAFCKIQDGCDNQCSYCIVTIARGPQQSEPPERILADVRGLVAAGYQEIALTGVHIGAYGRDAFGDRPAGGWDLARLVREILERTAVPRLRLSSIEPWDLSEALLALWPHPRLCPHLHLPLQSGCDATLQRMARRYTSDTFRQRVMAFRQRVPDGSVTSDVIVGFPGESDAEFAQSLAFIREIGFARLHVFRYSSRPGTAAAGFSDQIPPQVASARSQTMRDAGAAMAQVYHRRLLGRVVPVLFESRVRGRWLGLTDTYVRATAASDLDLHNCIVPVQAIRADAHGIEGEVVSAHPCDPTLVCTAG